MATAKSEPTFVTMRDGSVLPILVLRRVWGLEERGVTFRLDGDAVTISPGRLLDDNDRAFLREHKAMLISILSTEVRA